MEIIALAIAAAVLFNLLQQMEQWLHQHLFKVGWLLTKNFQTTTILYYTFFLPGVALFEFVRYLAAGMLNVRAQQALAFPEKQEIGELKLNFIRLNKKAPVWKVRLINEAAPPIVGLVVIWVIANAVFDIRKALDLMQPGTTDAILAGVREIISTSDLVIWMYLVFTISNVTIPNSLTLKWRNLAAITLIPALVLWVTGFADEVSAALAPPLLNGLVGFVALFALLIGINGAGTAVLSLIENTYERITGDSATFKNGKLIAMRREEILKLREEERQKELKAQQQRKQKQPALPAGPPSIYRLMLPIPGGPGVELVTQAPAAVMPTPVQAPLIPERPRREMPTLIEGDAPPAPKPAEPLININPGRGSNLLNQPVKPTDEADESASNFVIKPAPRPAITSTSGQPRLMPDAAPDDGYRDDYVDEVDEDYDKDEEDYDDADSRL